MAQVFFVSKGLPNLIKSAGDIRALNMLKILKSEYNIHVFSRSADFGDSDVKGLGCEPHLTGDLKNTFKNYADIQKPEIVILSHWTIANELIDFVRDICPNSRIFIDTIDVEFLRLQRKLQFDSSSISDIEVERVKKLELEVYKKADGLIAASSKDKEELLKHHGFNVIELPCLYSINNAYVPNEGRNSYIICNWTHEPNIASTAFLCEQVIPFTDLLFYIVGKHPPEQIRKFESSKITICGAEYEINKFLSKMNLLLCPVFYGAGMNGKIGESLAFGIPVITSDLGALPFDLEHKKTAMIANSKEEFISCIDQVLNDSKLRNDLSFGGRKLMEKFTINFFKEKFLKGIKTF